jgi:hypothetical protein
MRFEVPQFIEIEDKIFGPLTWRQFLYLGGGIGMAVVLFLRLPFLLFVLSGIPLAMISGALAFYPVNNRPFSYFLEAVVNYFSQKRLYLWRKEEMTYKIAEAEKSSPELFEPQTRTKRVGDLSSLARRLELQAIEKKS